MVKRIANAVIKFCDFMNGYHGKEITEYLISGILLFPFLLLLMMMLVFLS